MKKAVIIIVAMLAALAPAAQTLVVDETDAPLIGAVVLSANGTPLGLVDKNGMMPAVTHENYPLTLRCLGFENTILEQPAEKVVMKEKAYALGEVSVSPGDRPAYRLICYIRETSGINNGTDTVSIAAQYMADFMLKDRNGPKTKGFPTWNSPRVLNREIVQRCTGGRKLDENELSMLQWYSVCRLSDTDLELPQELQGKTSGSACIKSKKLGNKQAVYQLTPSQLTVFNDKLADREGHVWSPGLAKILGATMDVYELWSRATYGFAPDERYGHQNAITYTFSLKILGRGKLFHSILGSSAPVDITSYCEIYPVDIEYLKPEEARALKKEKHPSYPMTIPENAR